MSPEELELYRDIVQIGIPVLGTILGGLAGSYATVRVTRLNQMHERDRESRQTELDLLSQISKDVTEFEHIASDFVVTLSNHLRGIDDTRDLDVVAQELSNQSHTLRRARANLKLLGMEEAEDELDKYAELTREALRFKRSLKKERANEIASIVAKGPQQFFERIAERFRANK